MAVTFTDQSTGSPTGWAWYFGDENYTAPWTLVNASAGWSARYGHSGVVMPDGSIVLMGGVGGAHFTLMNDVWQSIDKGATWMLMNASAGWSPRWMHTSVAMPDGSIVLMGGNAESEKNDTWRSIDKGATWMLMNASAGWSPRWMHTSVAMPDGSIILTGGTNNYHYLSYRDVWRSTDYGATWTLINANPGWMGGEGFSLIALPDGSIVLIGCGGSNPNDVWRSTDNGATWAQVQGNSGFTSMHRDGFNAVAMPDGSIVVMAGYSADDVWRSTDNGATWAQVNASAGWSFRSWPTSVAMPDGSIILMGGYNNGAVKNDVWRMMPAGSSAQNPSHTYTGTGNYSVALQAYNAGGSNVTEKHNYISVTSATTPSKIGYYQPGSSGVWRIDYNGNGRWDGAVIDRTYSFGTTGSVPVTGDWNNNGRTEIGYYQPGSSGVWRLDYSGNGRWDGTVIDRTYTFGMTGAIPVTGDWNNDGRTEIGYYQAGTNGIWRVDYNGNGRWDGSVIDRVYVFGKGTTAVPVTGDWNNDGRTDIGYYQAISNYGVFRIDYNGNGRWDGAIIDRTFTFGRTGSVPVTGDWDKDSKTEIGYYLPGSSYSVFRIDYNANGRWDGGVIDRVYVFGTATDTPVSGKW